MKISNVITQMAAVEGGSGLSILPRFMADTRDGLTRILSNAVSIARSYWLLSHADTEEVRQIRAAVNFIQACVKEYAHRFLPRRSRT